MTLTSYHCIIEILYMTLTLHHRIIAIHDIGNSVLRERAAFHRPKEVADERNGR